jgi:AAA ATPase domain
LALQPPLPPWERAGVRVPGSASTSPFITGTPIEHPKNFFGREKELKRLFNLLKTHPLQNAAISGKPRSGKTSLLNYLRRITTTPVEQLRPGQKCDWLPNPQAYRWIFVDFQDVRMAQRERLLRFLLESMELPVPEPCDLESFMDQVSGNVQQPTVILMDEVGVGLRRCPELDDEFWECLRALATNQTGGNLAFVLATPEDPINLAHNTGHSSPFFNIFGFTTTIETLTEVEARKLIDFSTFPFEEADIDWILNHSYLWPYLLQILCYIRLFYLQDKDLSDGWQREGLEQIAKYSDLLKKQ